MVNQTQKGLIDTHFDRFEQPRSLRLKHHPRQYGSYCLLSLFEVLPYFGTQGEYR